MSVHVVISLHTKENLCSGHYQTKHDKSTPHRNHSSTFSCFTEQSELFCCASPPAVSWFAWLLKGWLGGRVSWSFLRWYSSGVSGYLRCLFVLSVFVLGWCLWWERQLPRKDKKEAAPTTYIEFKYILDQGSLKLKGVKNISKTPARDNLIFLRHCARLLLISDMLS